MIVGRDAERALLTGFLDAGIRAQRGPAAGGSGDDRDVPADDRAEVVAAILTGPAGIGKTALWEWTLEQAASLGYLVLAPGPASPRPSFPGSG